MALEQLPDVALWPWPDFTLSSVNTAYKGARLLASFHANNPGNLDPKTLLICFSSALPSLAAEAFA